MLLDTHAFLWWLADDVRLSMNAIAAIDNPDSEVLVSAASVWEVTTKHRIGKLPTGALVSERLPELIRRLRFTPLGISVEHAHLAGRISGEHRDPFDRMLAAQAIIEAVPIITNDAATGELGCNVLW